MQNERTITPESFSELLKWLGQNPESCGDEYELIRARLIRFFTIKGCYEADRLADETIDRVLLKLPTIRDDYVGEPAWYFLNVASKVYLEWSRLQRRQFEPVQFEAPDVHAPDDEREFVCLDKCLAELPEEARSLILDYYNSEDTTAMGARKRLADDLAISLSALHIRASRIRTKLYSCVKTCLDKEARKVS